MINTLTKTNKLTLLCLVQLLLTGYAFAQAPRITSVNPSSGTVGSSVTITGTDFNTQASNNVVYFGGVSAAVTSANATSLTVTVPNGATYQSISVLNTANQLAAFSPLPFLPTFTGKNSIIASDIAARVSYTTGTGPVQVTAGDLDGDGKTDLVVVNNTTNTLSILRNTATSGVAFVAGSLAAKVDITTGTGPFAAAIGDLDGDGKPDIAVANFTSNTVSVFYNTSTSGNISFATKVDFTTGSSPRGVAIADIDGDGKPDVVVSNQASNTVSVFRNTATAGTITNGSFAAKIDFATGANPRNLAIGDLDGDDKPDIATANFGTNTTSVLLNNGGTGISTSTFAAKVDFIVGTHPYSAAIADIDGDGKLDLILPNQGSNTVSILKNTFTQGSIGAGSFATTVDFATGVSPSSVAVGDIDGDGKPDLVVTNQTPSTISILRNTSINGTINTTSLAAKLDIATASTPYSSVIADIDGDGKPDIVTANNGGNTLSVLRNVVTPITYYSKATGDLSLLSTYGTATDGTGTAPTDFNGSGSYAIYQLANRSSYALTTGLNIGSVLNIPSGISLDLAGNTLTANTLAGTGTISGSNTSALVVNGGPSNISFASGKEQLNNLTLGTGATVTLNSALNIASAGTVSLGSNAVLNTGGLLTLKSTSAGTALISALGSGASVSGNVTVERYVFDKRAWRLITSPVSGNQTINAAWQEGGSGTSSNPKPGYGTFLIGSSTGNGFDIAGSAGSLLVYNGSGLNNVANTNAIAASSNPGYFLFSIGNRGLNPTTAGFHSSTTLRNTGALKTGTQTLLVNAAGFTLVGNPYAAPVDFSQVTRSSSIPNQFYAWDINLGTYGGYVLVSNSGSGYTSVPTSPSGLNNIIASGAAIFVQADGSNAGTLTFNETSKASAAGSGSFSTFSTSTAANSNVNHDLRINLNSVNTDRTSTLVDGVMASFGAGYSNQVDNNDVIKLSNFDENIALSRSGKQLILERRSDIVSKDTIFIQLYGMKATGYQLQINPADFNTAGMVAYLDDAYLHTHTKVDLTQVSTLSFNVTADTASYKNRFEITFTPARELLSFVNVSGTNPDKQIVLKWNVSGEDFVDQYTIQKWNGAAYTAIASVPSTQAGSYSATDRAVVLGDNTYRVDAKDIFGNIVSSDNITMKISHLTANVVAYPNPVTQKQVNLSFDGLPAGNYTITVMNTFGQILQKNTMLYNGTAASKLLNTDYNTGVYTVNIQSAGYNQSLKLIIQ